MSKAEHRLGVSPVNLVTRKLNLQHAAPEVILEAVNRLDELYGMDDVAFDAHAQTVTLHYDATRLCLDGVEDVLKAAGIKVSSGRWMRLKESYYRFVDENIRDNAQHEPWCCHRN